MGLLGSVLGAVLGGGQQQAGAANAAGAAAGLGGLGGIIGMVANNPQMMSVITGMLGNDGANGGLGGLADKFQQAGLGDAMNSWIGNGENQPIDGDQLSNALGKDAMGDIASKLGMNGGDAAGQLAQILPGLINHMTPNGQAPAGGLGNAGDLMGMLGSLLQKR